MPVTSARTLGAAELRQLIVAGSELALLDPRETGVFNKGHLLFAVNLPLSRLELRIDDLVPRLDVPVILCAGAGDDVLVQLGAERLSRFGYTDISYLEGGVGAWADAGFEVFSGVNVPSKAFGEFIEEADGTPHIPAAELKAMQDGGDNLIVLDSRPMAEFRRISIPGGIDVPGAELVYRVHDLAPDPATTVVVNCAGRTRSIIGAQSLINAGIPNRVVALENGTMGWHLAGLELDHGRESSFSSITDTGAARAQAAGQEVARRFDVPEVSKQTLADWQGDTSRTTYLLDVRDPAEYTAGHQAGARSAPGGQLVQATDEYVGVRGARLVLTDNDGVRATMTASWLIQMGWADVYVLSGGLEATGLETGPRRARIRGLEDCRPESITPAELAAMMEQGDAVVVDLANSLHYNKGHIAGAWFAIRSRMPENLDNLPAAPMLVLTSKHGLLPRLAAAEAEASGREVRVLEGGTDAWVDAGLPVDAGFINMADEPEDRWYKPYDLEEGDRNAMKEYLSWEVDLVGQIERDGTAGFRRFPE